VPKLNFALVARQWPVSSWKNSNSLRFSSVSSYKKLCDLRRLPALPVIRRVSSMTAGTCSTSARPDARLLPQIH
jgi:hypothetical protein